MLFKSSRRLKQRGFLYVGSFDTKEQAEERAKHLKDHGFNAEVLDKSVWMKEV